MKFPQEHLDSLAAHAAELLSRLGAADTAIISTRTEARVFLRGTDDGNEVLCTVSAPDAPIGPVLAAGRAMLAGLGT